MDIDTTLLQQVLSWVVAGGGAGIVTYFAMENWVPDDLLSHEGKRYLSLALAAVLAMAAFSLSVLLGYQPDPTTVQGWAESLFAVAFVATGLSQVIHGRMKLRE